MTRPASVRTGMFCKFGSAELKRPVDATVWLNVVWMCSSGCTVLIRPSMVDLSFWCSRCASRWSKNGCGFFSANASISPAAVEYPVLVFFVFGSSSLSKSTADSCFGEDRFSDGSSTNARASCSICSTFSVSSLRWFSSTSRSTAMPVCSISASTVTSGSSRSA